jgi:hypothetical protein
MACRYPEATVIESPTSATSAPQLPEVAGAAGAGSASAAGAPPARAAAAAPSALGAAPGAAPATGEEGDCLAALGVRGAKVAGEGEGADVDAPPRKEVIPRRRERRLAKKASRGEDPDDMVDPSMWSPPSKPVARPGPGEPRDGSWGPFPLCERPQALWSKIGIGGTMAV